ncbi:MAG: PQQ-like beta-propeller repeat protein [Candidatus Bathyarchaeota archaeon]|nr:PQQ-like beta-propeller repeat protein [Candidatus Bathyarchaeota archaeon]
MFLTIIMVLPIASLYSAEGQTLQLNYPDFAYVAVAPNPTGVGQPVTIVVWTAEMPPTTPLDYTLGSVGSRNAWTGWTITITDPNNKTETISLPPSDPVGGGFCSYTPTIAGNYSIQSHLPAQWKNTTGSSGYNRLYRACDSEITTLRVTEDQLTIIPGVPLPSEYWTRPINSYNREWSMIAGNWITGNRGLQYVTSPNSAHVMWTEPYFFGGIAGGEYESLSYHTGSAYEGKFGGATIIQGRLYYNLNLGSSTTTTKANIICRDLRTGELIWKVNQSAIGASTIYEYQSPNQHGVHPYLWTSGASALTLSPGAAVPTNTIMDPFQGTELFSYDSVPSGTVAVGPTGERLVYVFGGSASNRTWLSLWNASASLELTGLSTSGIQQFNIDHVATTSYWQYRPVGKTINGTTCYTWNVTLPANLGTTYQVYAFDDMMISGTGFVQFGTSQFNEQYTVWAISLKPENRGQLLWKIAPKPPAANVTLQWSAASVDAGILVLRAKETRQFIAYDITSGKQLWTTEPQPQWMMYSSGADIQNGMLYSGGYGGIVYAYDVETGDLVWESAVDAEGLESAYERTPLTVQVLDGKVFARSQEHSHTHPLYRTWKIYCFNATTGDRIWDLLGLWENFAFSDGYAVSLNEDDEMIYCIGKGPSATTIEASPKVSLYGNSVIVEGSVTDIASGTTSNRVAPRFPNGVPAVSDDSMTQFMEYVYMQMPKPTNTTGVTVVLNVLDPNGNYYEVARTTSDADGFYKTSFQPEVPGEYTIIASFDGTNSYWPSDAKTAIKVDEAPTTAPTAAIQTDLVTRSDLTLYIALAAVAIIVAVAVATVLLLRKRP